MSGILKKVGSNLENLSGLLDAYRQQLENMEDFFKLSGKTLEEACRNHVLYYPRSLKFLSELKTIEDFIKIRKGELESIHWRRYLEGYSRALSQRDIQAYIAGEKDIIDMDEYMLDLISVRRDCEGVVEAFKSMGWTLGNITKIRVAQLELATL